MAAGFFEDVPGQLVAVEGSFSNNPNSYILDLHARQPVPAR